MKKLTAAVVVTLASLTNGCGGTDTSAADPSSTPSRPSPSAEASASDGGDGKSSKSPSGKASSPAGKQLLLGTVGSPDEPEAFTIQLTDSSGDPVTTLAAGEYQVKVTDPATLHNFHLTGSGVDESTSVSATGEVIWKVTLKLGSYTYICDPHPEMVGQVKVT
jgi:hypothetical protein